MRAKATLAGVLLVAGCGDPAGAMQDAGVDAHTDAPLNATACDAWTPGTSSFCLANESAGIEHRNDFYGSGVGVFDADGDGDLDIFAGGDAFFSVFFRNDGAGAFSDATEAVGLDGLREVHGITPADYDNDGDVDLYVTRQTDNVLLRNDGGVFTDVTATAGVGDARWGTTAAFADYDGDGLLDLAVANWADYLGTSQQQPNVVYHNEGDGTFSDVTEALGVAGDGFTKVVAFTDYDDDGDPDLLVANDFGVLNPPNVAYRNDGAGSPWAFTDVSTASGLNYGIYAMNVSGSDYDRDGDLDYYFTNIGCNVLARQEDGVFEDVAQAIGAGVCDTDDPTIDFAYQPADPGSADPEEVAIAAFQQRYVADPTRPALTSWSGVFFDFDHDGWEDLFMPNGQIRNSPRVYQDAWLQPNILLRNVAGDGDRRFERRGDSGLESAQSSRAATAADLDGDGDLDLLVTQLQHGATGTPGLLVYENRAADRNWLIVDLVGGADGPTPGSFANRDGIGARVKIQIGAGPAQMREHVAGGGYLSPPLADLHFGLGDAATVDVVEVRWPAPSTTVDRCLDVAANQRLVIHEGDCPP